jgi:hypothetical protein
MAKGMTEMADRERVSTTPKNYVDLDRLKNADGLVSIISMRRATRVITFGLFREFERDGAMERTQFVPEQLSESYLKLVQLTIKRIQEIRAQGVDNVIAEQGKH